MGLVELKIETSVGGLEKINIDALSLRAGQLLAVLNPKSEESGQVSYLIYVLDDIKKEGWRRSADSVAMLKDIDNFCLEIEAGIAKQRSKHGT